MSFPGYSSAVDLRIDGTLTAANNAVVGNDISITGDCNVTGNANIDTNLVVTGTSTITDALIINGPLSSASVAEPAAQTFANPVTANGAFGILSFNAGLNIAAGAIATQTVNNTSATANSLIIVSVLELSGNGAGSLISAAVTARADGDFTLTLANPTTTPTGAGTNNLKVAFMVIN